MKQMLSWIVAISITALAGCKDAGSPDTDGAGGSDAGEDADAASSGSGGGAGGTTAGGNGGGGAGGQSSGGTGTGGQGGGSNPVIVAGCVITPPPQPGIYGTCVDYFAPSSADFKTFCESSGNTYVATYVASCTTLDRVGSCTIEDGSTCGPPGYSNPVAIRYYEPVDPTFQSGVCVNNTHGTWSD